VQPPRGAEEEEIMKFAATGALAAAVAGLGLMAASAASAQEVTLKVHHFVGPKSVQQTVVMQPWADAVMRDSKGRIKVEIYPAMQLGGKPPELYDQVKDGVVDAVWTLPGYSGNRFLLSQVFEMPFMITTAEATTLAFQEFGEKHLAGTDFKDVKVLTYHTAARFKIHMIDAPIVKADDFKGRKVRATSRAMGSLLSALGATPVFMPVPAVPEALSKGVVAGAVLPWEIVTPLKVYELVNYHSLIETERGFAGAAFLYAMNKKKYESLPDDLKAVIDKNSGMTLAKRLGPEYDKVEVVGRGLAEKRGNKFNVIDPAEVAKMEKLAQPAIDKWVSDVTRKGYDGKGMLAEARALIDKYTRQTAAKK
jgi:TRAP-type C4-dicarboxylate transport system substrate-binding protein